MLHLSTDPFVQCAHETEPRCREATAEFACRGAALEGAECRICVWLKVHSSRSQCFLAGSPIASSKQASTCDRDRRTTVIADQGVVSTKAAKADVVPNKDARGGCFKGPEGATTTTTRSTRTGYRVPGQGPVPLEEFQRLTSASAGPLRQRGNSVAQK